MPCWIVLPDKVLGRSNYKESFIWPTTSRLQFKVTVSFVSELLSFVSELWWKGWIGLPAVCQSGSKVSRQGQTQILPQRHTPSNTSLPIRLYLLQFLPPPSSLSHDSTGTLTIQSCLAKSFHHVVADPSS